MAFCFTFIPTHQSTSKTQYKNADRNGKSVQEVVASSQPHHHPANIFYSLFLREIPRKCYACMLFVSLLVWLYHHPLHVVGWMWRWKKSWWIPVAKLYWSISLFHLLHTDGGERITRKKVSDRLTSKNSNATQRQQRSSINVTVSLFPTSLQKILFPISLGLDIEGIHVCFGFGFL